MTSTATATASAPVQDKRYRDAERALWNRYELEPTERFLDLDAPAARLRVLEVGSGEPVLFVHGTAGLGFWPSLLSQLPGYRSIVLERPGWGLSSAIDFSGHDYRALVAEVLLGVLDAFDPLYALAFIFELLGAMVFSTAGAIVLALVARDYRTANNLSGLFIAPSLLGVLAAMILLPSGVYRLFLLGFIFLAIGVVIIWLALRRFTLERLAM
jgi:hypothetical protein